LLNEAITGDAVCHGCFISLMEVFYRIWKNEGEAVGRAAYQVCKTLPIEWDESIELLERAASVKAQHPLSLADAWIAATALELGATLVHKDPEFENLAGLLEERLPYK
jgi:predicted nucleic acid-binding protein